MAEESVDYARLHVRDVVLPRGRGVPVGDGGIPESPRQALLPEFLHGIDFGAEAVVNASGVACQTTIYAVANHARVAAATAMLYHKATTAQDVITQLVYSLDSGDTWGQFGGSVSRATNPANGFASQSPVARPLVLQPGQSVQFGIATSGAAIVDAACELTVRLDGHIGVF